LVWAFRCRRCEPRSVLFPLFEIASNPTIRLSDIKARRFIPKGVLIPSDEELLSDADGWT